MKRVFIVGIMLLFSCAGIFAQNLTVDGRVSFRNEVWDNSDAPTTISIGLTVGYYIIEDLNIGLNVSYSKPENGFDLVLGPEFRYNFLKFEKAYFSLFGGLYYSSSFGAYFFNNNYRENDANMVSVALRPAIFFTISKNIEVYWRFAEFYYSYFWVTLKGTNQDHKANTFRLSGPFGNPSFGLVFRF